MQTSARWSCGRLRAGRDRDAVGAGTHRHQHRRRATGRPALRSDPNHRPHRETGRHASSVMLSSRVAVEEVSAEVMREHVWQSVDLWSTELHAAVRCGEGEPQYHLCYMAMRNRCEISRLILEETRTPYTFEVVGFKAWPGLKPSTPLGKVPVLRDFDGRGSDLPQETAIMRFLAKRLGLAGKDAIEEAAVDSLFQHFWSTLRSNGLSHDGEHYSADSLREAAAAMGDRQRAACPRYQDMRRVNNFSVSERSLAALFSFEEQLVATGTGYLVGDSVTYIDLALFNILFELAEADNVPDFFQRFGLPRLGEFLSHMESRPQILDYLRSPRRMPRYSRPGYVYKPGKYSPMP